MISEIHTTGAKEERRADEATDEYDTDETTPESSDEDTESDKEGIGAISFATNFDYEQQAQWNLEDPEILDTTLHEMVSAQASRTPDAIAIRAEDGTFTYAELDAASSRLATHITTTHPEIRPNDIVHLLFEKSAWYIVALLAVNKAGAAWCPLDPSHPRERHDQVVSQTKARLALVSTTHATRCDGLLESAIEVSPVLDERLRSSDTSETVVSVNPRDAAYVLFTSGSTGRPKGFIMEHVALCTNQVAVARRLQLDSSARMLQFSAFVFDISVSEIVASLFVGATICIPSDETRLNSMFAFIREEEISWALLTPSYARTLVPEEIPSVRHVVTAGEPATRDLVHKFHGKLRFLIGWGPAETCVYNSFQEWTDESTSTMTIGRPMGCYVWIVDPEDPSRLVPPGTVGEAVIQGPSVMREYIGEPEKTAAAIVTGLPSWAPRTESSLWNRFYRTGDLCAWNVDGTLEITGRKDTQVKIRGQRVELGEVEHHVQRCMPEAKQVCAGVIQTHSGGVALVAYFCTSLESRTAFDNDLFLPIDAELSTTLQTLADDLSRTLAPYMVPSVFVPCAYMPFNTAAKLERRALARMAEELSHEKLASYSLQEGEKAPPETEMERRLQVIWAETLNLPAEEIGRRDNFLRIGGDSLAAIHMVTAAREEKITLTVKDVLDEPTLAGVAAKAAEAPETAAEMVASFSLIDEEHKDDIRNAVGEACGVEGAKVKDVYPCTSLQTGLMALGVKQPGSYIIKEFFLLPSGVDVSRFKKAWETTVSVCANLSTRIVHVDASFYQGIVDEPASWLPQSDDLTSLVSSLKSLQMGYGQPLCRAAIVEASGEAYFVWVIHHAISDGWSSLLIQQVLSQTYRGMNVTPPVPYAGFIKYITNIDTTAAETFWRKRLDGAQRAAFPAPRLTRSKARTRMMTRSIQLGMVNTTVTKANLLRAAWALVLARYCNTDDITFGMTVSGRNAPVPGLDRMVGPAVATIPVRVRLRSDDSISSFLLSVQGEANDGVAFEQFGIQNIARVSPDAKDASDFSTLLVIQPMERDASSDQLLTPHAGDVEEEMLDGYFSYPLVTDLMVYADRVDMIFTYKMDHLGEAQLDSLARQFEHTVSELLAPGRDRRVGNVSIAGPWDRQHAIASNGDYPVLRERVHDLISQRAAMDPDHEALSSSMEALTYGDLDRFSARLAHHLADLGIVPESAVPFCFDKCIWTVVAMLAILKAGGVFIPLDPSHPYSRRKELVKDVKATVMLVSPGAASTCQDLVKETVVLTPEFLRGLPDRDGLPPQPTPDNAAYILFTSGSTGKPKAIVVDHTALATSLTGYGRAYTFTPDTRTLQFSSYVFDVSLCEILETLIFGGTVCVPSAAERVQGLSDFVSRMSVNTALLTPSFIRTLTPDVLPSLNTLLLVGEPATADVIDTWHGHVDLINAYGPSESSVFCSSYKYTSSYELPTNVGKAFSGALYVVDDECRLAPVGCIGEILLQRHMARGYLNDETRTQESFFDSVDWLPRVEGDTRRFYKTGDLGRLQPDGTIEYLGRRDTQVKVRGFRIELGEIEYHIKARLQSIHNVVVDVSRRDTLVAFLHWKGDHGDGELLLELQDEQKEELSRLVIQLRTILPEYMIPGLFLPVRALPTNTSMKVDRRALAAIADALSPSEAAAYSLSRQDKVQPTSEAELKMRDLWAQVLGLDADDVGAEDRFLEIGGDSITAIQLASLAQKEGMPFAVSTLFEDSRLSHVAAAASKEVVTVEISPFSIIPSSPDDTITEIRTQSHLVDTDLIADAYPCTALQQGMLALSAKQPGAYINHAVYTLPPHIDIERFRRSWEQTVAICSNLRTRVVLVDGIATQSVIDCPAQWDEADELLPYLAWAKKQDMGYGSRLCRYALIKDDENYFVWSMHHAIYDGWTSMLVAKVLTSLYNNIDVPSLSPFVGFIQHTRSLDHDAQSKWWHDQLEGSNRAAFPQASGTSPITRILTRRINLSDRRRQVTRATLLRAAWALVLARYTDSAKDITFGTTVSGRTANVPGLTQMVGSTLATVPVRVRIEDEKPLAEFLGGIQAQTNEMVPYEQFGLHNIARVSEDTRIACDFANILIIQPGREPVPVTKETVLPTPGADKLQGEDSALDGQFNYPLVVEANLLKDGVDLVMTYKGVDEKRLDAFAQHLDNVVQQLTSGAKTVGQISLSGEWDRQLAVQYNSHLKPEWTPSCLHELVSAQAAKTPDAEALYSTARSLTYRELDQMTDRVASHFISELNISAESIVPICFEKSVWAIVAILGILKVGAAFSPIDPAYPIRRKQAIIEELGAKSIVTSTQAAETCRGLVPTILPLTEDFITGLPSLIPTNIPTPHNAAYVLFTSGSTGKPKGIVVEHGDVAHSLQGQGKILQLRSTSRFLQFANYTFDVMILEIFGTLLAGGCVCTPTEGERLSHTAEFITASQTNVAFLTPTFARILAPADVPTLRTLCVGGEAPAEDTIRTWQPAVDLLVNGYGPTETCVLCVMHTFTSPDEAPTTTGTSFSGPCWVIDDDGLAPIGCVGELVVQGPGLARSYLNNPDTTASAFHNELACVPDTGHPRRFYRTGDLVSYNADGLLEYHGRRDAQAKLRGQRLELAEIEYHIQRLLPSVYQTAVGVHTIDGRQALVASLSFGDHSSTEATLLEADDAISVDIITLSQGLSAALPSYMVPSVFLPLSYLPLLPSMKLDRKKIRGLVDNLSSEMISAYVTASRQADTDTEPLTDTEKGLRDLWAEILRVDATSIRKNAGFLEVGGDSITAIQLVTLARRQLGLDLTVAQIFADSRLCTLAATHVVDIEAAIIPPFSLLPPNEDLLDTLRTQCHVSPNEAIEDAYPCGPLQEGLMALSVTQPGSYIIGNTYRLPPHINADRFRQAWALTVKINTNLRTRIVNIDGQSIQVVIDEEPDWEEDTGGLFPYTFIRGPRKWTMTYGTRLCRYALVTGGGELYFAWDMHHAVVDGWSMNIGIRSLSQAYSALELDPLPTFSGFIQYVQAREGVSEYWREQLDGARRTTFPPIKTRSSSNISRIYNATIPLEKPSDSSITKASILRAAWALLLARYTDSDDVCFGMTVSGREAAVPGLTEMPGPTVTTVPIRIKRQPGSDAVNFLSGVQRQAADMVPYEQVSLSHISKLSVDAKAACDFRSLLVLQPKASVERAADGDETVLVAVPPDDARVDESVQGYYNYPLVVQAFIEKDTADLVVVYNTDVLAETQVEALTKQYGHIVQQLTAATRGVRLGDISVAGPWDAASASKCNEGIDATMPPSCLHTLISAVAKSTPTSEAVSSTTHVLTYADLDRLTDNFASYLVTMGVDHESMVPICSEKSIWVIIAMIGIMKAGGVFIPIDPNHPESRRRFLVEDQLKAKHIVVSPATAATCKSLGVANTIQLSEKFLYDLEDAKPSTKVHPSDAAYVLFTSGTTGNPKGIIVEHSAVCLSLSRQATIYSLNATTRFLQFSNYVFDGFVTEAFGTLISGGAICVPCTDDERLANLGAFIRQSRVNSALLTPSFAQTLNPEHVPGLQTLLLGGEASTPETLRTWQGRTENLINAYGPTETVIISLIHKYSSEIESPKTLSTRVAGPCWVVEPDHKSLTPIGCVGELVCQGGALARGYLNDAEKTSAAFVDDISCIPIIPGHRRRFYLTGDLVRVNVDGTFEYIGRRDTQRKIRGQRMEVAEIEHQIKRIVLGVNHVAVDVVELKGRRKVLVAFMSFIDRTQGTPGEEDSLLTLDETLKTTFNDLAVGLEKVLPGYMVPSFFLPVGCVPFGSSMKLDRKALFTLAGNLPADKLSSYSKTTKDHVPPETDMEIKLAKIWAQVLRLEISQIGKHDAFLEIGGDSINAIQLVSVARQKLGSSTFTVVDIFADSRLNHLAEIAATADEQDTAGRDLAPYALLPVDNRDALLSSIREQCNLDADQSIDDVFPCGPLQEGLIALSVRQPGSYVMKNTYRLPRDIDTTHFKAAWAQTMQTCTNLRTRIVHGVDGCFYQAHVNSSPIWEANPDSLDVTAYSQFASKEWTMGYGARLCRYALIQDGLDHYFIWNMHHAVFDGWSFGINIDVLHDAYRNLTPEPPRLPPFAHFIDHVLNIDETRASQYWQDQLLDAKRASFPPAPAAGVPRSGVSKMHKSTITLGNSQGTVTKGTVLRAAWAIVLARYCESDDVCFGATVSGRYAPVPGVSEMPGPMIATIPIRFRLDMDATVGSQLVDIQDHATKMTAYEQFGLSRIAKLSPDAKEACDFSSLMIVQPKASFDREGHQSDLLGPANLDDFETEDAMQGFFNYQLVLQIFVEENDEVSLLITYDTDVLAEAQIEGLTKHYETVARQLLARENRNKPLSEISLAGPWDLERALQFNRDSHVVVSNTCFHDLIEQQQPGDLAVCAWDGSFTYKQLNAAANQLAHHLVHEHGVVPDELVHVCFDKSAWYIVTILAINKAGGCWVPLEPSHPDARQQKVVSQTRARLALCSPNHVDLCGRLVETVVVIAREVIETLRYPDSTPKTGVAPKNAMYLLFTSGSTGVPKGFVMQHDSVCTSQLAIGKRLRMDSNVQMLHFASHIFDMSVGEICLTLLHGGTIYIPSEETRMNNIKQFIVDMGINWLFLTPAYIRTLQPSDVPSVEAVILAGEAVGRDVLDTWVDNVRLINGWGPAETCVVNACHEWPRGIPNQNPMTVGRPVGGLVWIVDEDDPCKLAPIGAVGEAVIQGPTLLREYLGDPERTLAATMTWFDPERSTELPEWAPQRSDPHWNRFYKTGDLVRFNTADGTIDFVSRKDTQIKIRGLRVELGEVEHHVLRNLEGLKQVAVDVHKNTDTKAETLAAYFCFTDETRMAGRSSTTEAMFSSMDEDLQTRIVSLVGALGVAMPRYMVPTIFILCNFMPVISSTKLDRKELKAQTSRLTPDEMATYTLSSGSGARRPPETPMEQRLQKLWARILKVDADTIGRDDNFLRIGGDSIAAIQLVAAARVEGITLFVQDIFDDPRLSAVSIKAAPDGADTETPLLPWALLDRSVEEDILAQCDLAPGSTIEDAYPTSPLQEGLLALGAQQEQPGSYTAKYVFRLGKETNITKFKAAFEQTLEACANLRTRIVLASDSRTVQTVIREEPAWENMTGLSLSSATKNAQKVRMSYGDKLVRYALLKETDGTHYFLWTLHHAIFDGFSFGLVLRVFQSFYHGSPTPALQAFARFIQYTSQQDTAAAREFWTRQLTGSVKASFPQAKSSESDEMLTRVHDHTVHLTPMRNPSVTHATVIRAAWALVLARYSDTKDVCFAATVSGRSAAVHGLDGMPGPTVATIPVRIRLDHAGETIAAFLKRVQKQYTDTIPYEQTGLRNIARLGPDMRDACDFSSLFVIQPLKQDVVEDSTMMQSLELDQDARAENLDGYFNYPLALQAGLSEDRVVLDFIYDGRVIGETGIEALCHHFEHVVAQLQQQNESRLESVALAGTWDIQQAELSYQEPETAMHWDLEGKRGTSVVRGPFWVVEQDNRHQLAPIGCSGELVVQSPKAVDSEDPLEALADVLPWSQSPLYATGHLVRYAEGHLDFIGLIEDQATIRSSRVNLADLNVKVAKALDLPKDIGVTVVAHSEALVAFLNYEGSTSPVQCLPDNVLGPEVTKDMNGHLPRNLKGVLPDYLIPKYLVPIRHSPGNDHLRQLAAEMHLDRYLVSPTTDKAAPETPMERRMRSIWASVLGLDEEDIDREDSFTHLGGDSIAVLHLVKMAAEADLTITVNQVLQDPRLSAVAAKIETSSAPTAVAPFSLLNGRDVLDIVATQCAVSKAAIQDVFPCTPMQEGLIAIALSEDSSLAASYIAKFAFALPSNIDSSRLLVAVEEVYDSFPNLRTRLVIDDEGTILQTVLDDGVPWTEELQVTGDVARTFSKHSELGLRIGLGTPLSSLTAVRHGKQVTHLIWQLHHTIYDGWAFGLLVTALNQAYAKTAIPTPLSLYAYSKYINETPKESADAFWRQQLEGASSLQHFPVRKTEGVSVAATREHTVTLPGNYKPLPGITMATIIQAAWAIVLATYQETDDVVFGLTVSGRSAPVQDILRVAGPTTATVPICARLPGNTTVVQFLQQMQKQTSDMIPYEHVGLQTIAQMGPDAKEACAFRNLMVVQAGDAAAGLNSHDSTEVDFGAMIRDLTYVAAEGTATGGFHSYPLVIQVVPSPKSVHFTFAYDVQYLGAEQVEALSHHLATAVYSLASAGDDTPLSTISLVSDYDAAVVDGFLQPHDGKPYINVVDRCIHDIIAMHSRSLAPDHEAVHSWDGNLTYPELDCLSDRLAAHLRTLGVGPEVFVPLCFEKSKWHIISILAVLKAGGAFLSMDPTWPAERRKSLLSELANVKVIITSTNGAEICRGLVEHIVEVSAATEPQFPAAFPTEHRPDVKPDNAAYAIFTSGSTGRPKCVVAAHANISSSSSSHGDAWGLTQNSRLLHFSNCAFDVSIAEVLTTLLFGATICIPSEGDRVNSEGLSKFIASSRTDIALFTPSFLEAALNPDDIPSVKTIVLGGEAPTRVIAERWHDRIRLLNGYGPAETCIYTCAYPMTTPDACLSLIGHAAAWNVHIWIVDIEDASRLAPVGCIGEILLEGPILARGYYNRPDLTKKSYLELRDEDCPSLRRQTPCATAPGMRRFYKTGDLAKYRMDGKVDIMGRKDTQVKIRGQRMELGEVEHRLKTAKAADVRDAVVDVHKGTDRTSRLVTVVSFADFDRDDLEMTITKPTAGLRKSLRRLAEELSKTLPVYMVPDYFIPVSVIALTSSRKTDRKSVRVLLGGLDSTDLMRFHLLTDEGEEEMAEEGPPSQPEQAPQEHSPSKRQTLGPVSTPASKPTLTTTGSELEANLKTTWARVLQLPISSIGLDQSFSHLGGDSIRSITLGRHIERDHGVKLALRHLNGKNATISGIAALIRKEKALEAKIDILGPLRGEAAIDLAGEIKTLGEQLTWDTPSYTAPPPRRGSCVLLTGATGFLGTFLLRRLIQHPSVGQVIAIVRASSDEAGKDRVIRAAQIAGWWDTELNARERRKLTTWKGDLALPHLGLSPTQWARISGTSNTEKNIDAVVHNGAVVHWHADYTDLRAPNVSSTCDLLAAHVLKNLRDNTRFVYMSGGVKVVDTQAFQAAATKELSKGGTGYVQTKFLAETLVYNAAITGPHTNRVSVVKPGAILGPGDKGLANTDDYIWRVVAAAAAIGAYPVETEENWMFMEDADSLSRTTLGQIGLDDDDDDDDITTKPFVDVQSGITVPDFWKQVTAEIRRRASSTHHAATMWPVSWDDWTAAALRHMNDVGETHPLWPVQDFLGRLSSGSTPPAGVPARSSPERDRTRRAVRNNVAYLCRVGFIPTLEAEEEEEEVFRRSKVGIA